MKTVWKANIRPDSVRNAAHKINVPCPVGGKPISVGLQRLIPCVWFECDPTAPQGNLELFSVGTGFGAVPEGGQFLGTILEDAYVWHIYYLKLAE